MPIIHVSFKECERELYERIKEEAKRNFTNDSGWMKKAAAERIERESGNKKAEGNSFGSIVI